jgi:hypothetical protein
MSPALFRALGIFLPLITTNCAILAVALFLFCFSSIIGNYAYAEGNVEFIKNNKGVMMKPPPTPNSPDSTPTPLPQSAPWTYPEKVDAYMNATTRPATAVLRIRPD